MIRENRKNRGVVELVVGIFIFFLSFGILMGISYIFLCYFKLLGYFYRLNYF